MKNFLEDKTEYGKKISPVLAKGIKNYLIDIDGTICDDIPNEEPEIMDLNTMVWLWGNREVGIIIGLIII